MLTNNKVLRGRYRIIQPLGREAASSVYEAYDSERETNVALKEILIDLEKVANISQREKIKHDFANQAKTLAKVKHESLPQVRGYFAEIDRHYLIMELVDGTIVDEMSAESGDPAKISEVANWADQLLDALDYLHTFSPAIIHHDINPANVKLTSRGKIKLLGFSLFDRSDAETNMTVKNQSSVAVINYQPLEQIIRIADQSSKKKLIEINADGLKKILKQPVSERSDIYALGATAYYLLTGQVPINALDRSLEIWTGKSDPLLSAHQANPKVPTEVSDALAKAMEIEAAKRFETAAQMRQELQSAVKKATARTAEEAKEQEIAAARETFLAEEKRLDQERQRVEKERQRIEAERKQQAELIERQLKEAETQRIEAEKRAAEAEKRLSEEKESHKAASATAANSSKRETGAPNFGGKSVVFESPKSLFDESPADKKSPLTMPAIIVALLVIGGLTAGILFMRSSNAAESNPPSAPTVTADKPAAENPVAAPSPPAEKVSETVESPKNPDAPNPTAPTVSQNAPKPKTAPTAPPAKAVKPTAPPTKVATNQKKTVTVDDIIGN